MSKKKHIDELFKEQLQHFEASPSPDVWTKIQAKMKKEEEEDRKVIPIWWKLGGVAAALALLLALNFVFKPFGEKTEPILVNEDDTAIPIEDNSTTPVLEDATFTKDAITSESDKETPAKGDITSNPISKDKEETLKEKISEEVKTNRKAVASETKTELNRFETRSENNKKMNSIEAISEKDATGIASESDNPIQKREKEINPLIKKDASEGLETEVVTGVAKTTTDKTTNSIEKTAGTTSDKVADKNDAILKKDDTETNKIVTEESVAAADKVKETEAAVDSEEKKKSIFDAIEEDKDDAVAEVETSSGKSWEVTPNFGPVFYNSLDGGSAIDPSFADNSQSGDVNFSYGVQVSYAINDRLSVRSGVSNVDLGYTTGGVELATGPVAAALGSVDYGGRNVVLSAYDRGTLSNLPAQGEGDPFAGLIPKSTSGNAEIVQNLSYYEVPLELKYALLNKRFGLNMIGGFSTLFLGDNEISVQDGAFRDVLGAANNLNSLSFSTNIGLGLDYKISKRLKFNVEPMFKYQLNPYSDASVDFRPYYFGVYSGLSFKF